MQIKENLQQKVNPTVTKRKNQQQRSSIKALAHGQLAAYMVHRCYCFVADFLFKLLCRYLFVAIYFLPFLLFFHAHFLNCRCYVN